MKNPFLSMWLSAANTAAGATRAFWTAELQRQRKAIAKGVPAPGSKKPSPSKRKKARSK